MELSDIENENEDRNRTSSDSSSNSSGSGGGTVDRLDKRASKSLLPQASTKDDEDGRGRGGGGTRRRRVSRSVEEGGEDTSSSSRNAQRQRASRFAVTKDDLDVARKMFIGGCFFLPWLWVCSALYFYPKWKKGSRGDRYDDLCWYYKRYVIGGGVYAGLLLLWVVIFQTGYKSMGMESLLVGGSDSSGGWEDGD